jgi:hypothetical protein
LAEGVRIRGLTKVPAPCMSGVRTGLQEVHAWVEAAKEGSSDVRRSDRTSGTLLRSGVAGRPGFMCKIVRSSGPQAEAVERAPWLRPDPGCCLGGRSRRSGSRMDAPRSLSRRDTRRRSSGSFPRTGLLAVEGSNPSACRKSSRSLREPSSSDVPSVGGSMTHYRLIQRYQMRNLA